MKPKTRTDVERLPMLESLSGLLPASIPVIDVPELVKSSWNSFTERKLLVQNSLAEVSSKSALADHNTRLLTSKDLFVRAGGTRNSLKLRSKMRRRMRTGLERL